MSPTVSLSQSRARSDWPRQDPYIQQHRPSLMRVPEQSPGAVGASHSKGVSGIRRAACRALRTKDGVRTLQPSRQSGGR